MKDHQIVTARLCEDGYLKSEGEIRAMLVGILTTAEFDNMELVSTFRTENHILFVILRKKDE